MKVIVAIPLACNCAAFLLFRLLGMGKRQDPNWSFTRLHLILLPGVAAATYLSLRSSASGAPLWTGVLLSSYLFSALFMGVSIQLLGMATRSVSLGLLRDLLTQGAPGSGTVDPSQVQASRKDQLLACGFVTRDARTWRTTRFGKIVLRIRALVLWTWNIRPILDWKANAD